MRTPARPFTWLAAATMLTAATPLCAAAQGDSTWQDHNHAGALALRARDWSAYRYHHLRLDTLLRGLPLVQLRLASVEARLGQPEAALRRLERYAAMGLTADLAADSALAPARSQPGWAQVSARIARNAEPVRRGDTVVVLPSRDMLAEDIAYDPRSRRFFVSSMREWRILAVDRRGRVTDFVPSGQDGIWAAVGLGVDARRRLQWVTTDALAFQVGYDSADAGRAAVLAYDLGTGRLVRRIDAPRGLAPAAAGRRDERHRRPVRGRAVADRGAERDGAGADRPVSGGCGLHAHPGLGGAGAEPAAGRAEPRCGRGGERARGATLQDDPAARPPAVMRVRLR